VGRRAMMDDQAPVDRLEGRLLMTPSNWDAASPCWTRAVNSSQADRNRLIRSTPSRSSLTAQPSAT
jgi:hypothetical protein